MRTEGQRVLAYPQPARRRRGSPTTVNISGPSLSGKEWLVVLGIIVVLLAILCPVVSMIRGEAEKAMLEQEGAASRVAE
jgi:hypothetical protein